MIEMIAGLIVTVILIVLGMALQECGQWGRVIAGVVTTGLIALAIGASFGPTGFAVLALLAISAGALLVIFSR